jgi:hydroxymethylbilane synthase
MPDAHPHSTLPDTTQPPSHHGRRLPLRVGTRGSPLARTQTRIFLHLLTRFCPVLAQDIHGQAVFQEHVIRTTGDAVQDRSLAEIGGKGLFSKEIHEALLDHRIDFAVHSLKDLETELPPGIVLACTLKREDARDALILGPGCTQPIDGDPWSILPAGAVIGTNSLRRQAQLLHARPDLRITLIRGNVQPRIDKVARGDCTASLLALAGIRRLGLADVPMHVLDAEAMVPSAGQGIVGITVRAADSSLHALLSGIEDPDARAVSTAERAMLAVLDGNCRTPIGGYARLLPAAASGHAPHLHLTGLVARPDGSFLLKRSLHGPAADAARIGAELGASLRADSPSDILG